MTIDELFNRRSVTLLECISGSKAYGLDTEHSDTDIRGVFFMPRNTFYGFEYIPQVANDTNDIVYYEIGRFLELLSKNNPNILELLSTPEEFVLYKDPIMNKIIPELFLSKLCEQSFAGYAQSQIKKAYSLNKKIFNPVAEERKNIGDFCYVLNGQESIPLKNWLSEYSFNQEDCGLVNISHAKDVFALFHSSQMDGRLKGIYSGDEANDISLSSIPKGIQPLALMSFNKDGYSAYCKDYREYWDWVQKRNDRRYADTLEHGKNYDAKNMMHTFRLLHVAAEIATEKKVNVKRKDRDFLLQIRSGQYAYEQLLQMADEKIEEIKEAYKHADLPDSPDKNKIESLLVEIRTELYDKRRP